MRAGAVILFNFILFDVVSCEYINFSGNLINVNTWTFMSVHVNGSTLETTQIQLNFPNLVTSRHMTSKRSAG